MAKCPSCGTEAGIAIKSWPVSFKKPGDAEAKPQFCVGIFECPRCKSKFRSRVETATEAESPQSSYSPTNQIQPESTSSTVNVAGLMERINSIRNGLTQSLNTLRIKIGSLETERSMLLVEIEELKQAAELRAKSLESEVCQLREEIRSLRELLGANTAGTG